MKIPQHWQYVYCLKLNITTLKLLLYLLSNLPEDLPVTCVRNIFKDIALMTILFMPPQLKGGELDDEFIKSCRIRTGRSVRGFCLPPAMCRAERRVVEKVSAASG